jgi:excisionase family DNA binding protein
MTTYVGELVVSVTPLQNRPNRPLLSTTEASKISGLSKVYIQYLARTGRIEGTKPGGHDWMVYEDSLQAFLSQPRSPGRKGPRKKRIEQGDRVLLSTSEAHERYGYARNYLLELLRAGHIQGEKSGRIWLIYEDSLQAYKQHKHPTRAESPSALTSK